jgi:two-component system cell cycle response regulator DivK
VTVAKILVVEDNADNMKLFRAVLTLRGHAVTGLPGGEGLVDTVVGERPDLILLDIQLPGMDGFQLLALLRGTMPAVPPVVALTAHAMSGDRERALTAGFDGYLTKPIDVATFGETVERFIHR